MEIYSLDLLDCLISFAKRILSLQARTEFQVLETFEDAGQVRNSVAIIAIPWQSNIAMECCYGKPPFLVRQSPTNWPEDMYIYIHGFTWTFHMANRLPSCFNGGCILEQNTYEKPCTPSSKIMQAFCGFGCLVTPWTHPQNPGVARLPHEFVQKISLTKIHLAEPTVPVTSSALSSVSLFQILFVTICKSYHIR